MSIRILIAERQAVYRAGLRTLLEKDPEFAVVGEASSGADVIKARRLWETDVLLLDSGLPGPPSASGIIRALRESPRTNILIVVMNDDRWSAQDFLRLGARGCILKESTERELVRAIRVVAAREYYVDSELVGQGTLAPGAEERPPGDAAEEETCLDPLEQDVCGLLASGHIHAEIAQKFDISEAEVERHRQAIMTKLGLQTRADLVHYAIAHRHLRRS